MSLSAISDTDCIYYTFNGYILLQEYSLTKTLSKTHTKTYLSVVGGLWWTTNAQKQKTIFLISNKKRITYSTCDLYDFHIVYYTKKTIIIYPITDKCSPNGLERSTHSKEFNSSKCK